MKDAVFELFNSGRSNELGRSAFFTPKYHSPENVIIQHIPRKDEINNPYKKNR